MDQSIVMTIDIVNIVHINLTRLKKYLKDFDEKKVEPSWRETLKKVLKKTEKINFYQIRIRRRKNKFSNL